MLRVFKLAAAIVTLSLLGGCVTAPYDGTGRSPPEFKVHNAKRLVKEMGWFYADFQDIIFGVDYHLDLEREYGASPYN